MTIFAINTKGILHPFLRIGGLKMGINRQSLNQPSATRIRGKKPLILDYKKASNNLIAKTIQERMQSRDR